MGRELTMTFDGKYDLISLQWCNIVNQWGMQCTVWGVQSISVSGPWPWCQGSGHDTRGWWWITVSAALQCPQSAGCCSPRHQTMLSSWADLSWHGACGGRGAPGPRYPHITELSDPVTLGSEKWNTDQHSRPVLLTVKQCFYLQARILLCWWWWWFTLYDFTVTGRRLASEQHWESCLGLGKLNRSWE